MKILYELTDLCVYKVYRLLFVNYIGRQSSENVLNRRVCIVVSIFISEHSILVLNCQP